MNVREILKAYLDGELSPEEAALVAQALQADPGLRQEMEEMSKLSNAIKAFAREFQPQGYEQTISAVTSKPRRSLLSGWRGWAVGVPAVLLVLFVASKVVQPQMYASTAELAQTPAPVMSSAPAEEKTKSLSAEEPADMGGASRSRAPSPAESEATTPMMDPLANGTADATTQGTDATAYLNQRQLIKNGDLQVLVDDVQIARQQATDVAKRYSGFVENSSLTSQPKNRVAYLSVRVDSNRFEQAFDDLRGLGEVTSESSSGQDVTAQVADLGARAKVKRAEEEQYRELLKSAKTIGQVLEVKDRLARVREEIESTEAQIKALKNLASLSTINLTLEQKPTKEEAVPSDWAAQTWTRALNLLGDFGKFLAQVGIVLAVFSPVWVPVGLVVWWLRRRARLAK